MQGAPLFGLGPLLLAATWYAAKVAIRIAHSLFRRRMSNRLLQQVAARLVAVPVFILGVYLVLRIAGLTQMAATVIGGTGLLGLIIGIAFRDIAENFLASLLISTQRPFAIGDLIEVENQKGYVQGVTTRGTLLMTLDGNHVQIPNATMYKAIIRNFTANPKIRQDFTVGIGYDESTSVAQQTAQQVLKEHLAVLEDPEPLMLVEELGSATVRLRVYFWIDGQRHSMFKVRSSVIRQVKSAFEQSGISMPDEAREVIFPDQVPVRILRDETPAVQHQPAVTGRTPKVASSSYEPTPQIEKSVTTAAEGDLASEAEGIRQQARTSRSPDQGPNLIGDESENADSRWPVQTKRGNNG